MTNSTLAYCQKSDRRYEADTNAESECPFCRAEAAEARAAQLEAERDELARKLEQEREIKKALSAANEKLAAELLSLKVRARK